MLLKLIHLFSSRIALAIMLSFAGSLLGAMNANAAQVTLAWDPVTGATGYKLYYGTSSGNYTEVLDAGPTPSIVVTGLVEGTTYYFAVTAYNETQESGYSNEIVYTVPFDTQAPTAPESLAATVASSSVINLTWTAATDNVAVTGYRVFRNNTQVATVTTTSYSNTGLTASTAYTFYVRAQDAAGNLSANSNTVTATTSAGADTQAPTAPGSLAATVASSSVINLTWAASTDNVAVTGYRVFRNNTQVATVTTTSYSNTGLTASTAYTFYVRAQDAAGNVSGNSNTVSATTSAAPDTQAPTAPGSLAATVASSSVINLTWAASTDNVAVTGYRVFRNNTQVATVTTTSYSNTGLTASTAYTFYVRAQDAAGNVSGNSNTVSATTSAAPDTQAPTAPGSLAATVASSSVINLTWAASTDNVAVTGYRVFRNNTQVATVTTTSYSNTGLTASTAYTFYVRAQDAAGNVSGNSNTVSATTSAAPDTQAPTAPGSLAATVASSSVINLNWAASTDNVAVTGYRVFRNNTQVATVTTTSYSNTGLTASTAYTFYVRAQDAAGNVSGNSNTVTATTSAAADTQAPTAPGSLAATVVSSSVVNLTWAASTDNVAVTGYRVFRDNTQVATVTTTSYSNTGLTPNTSYVFWVRAQDAAGNVSANSNYADATTSAAADTQAPTAPGSLAATVASSSVINLTWAASTDNVAVTGYRVFRNNTQVATVTTREYSNTGLTASTAYTFYVRAQDAAGNVSGNSNTVTATTSAAADTQAPTAPGSLAATVASSSVINLTWAASTDNVAVTGYRVFRNNTQVATVTTREYSNTGLTASTAYTFYVRAQDAAGNVSGNSNTVTATTSAAADTQAPTAPGSLAATVVSSSVINLQWAASTDNVAVTGYRVFRNNTQVATVTTTSYSNTGLTASTAYTFYVRAQDAAGNVSGNSNTVTATTSAAGDTQAPTAPGGLAATVVSSSVIDLTWNGSTDNVGVTGYRVFRNSTQVATVTTTSYSNTGLTPSTSYTFWVRAQDAAGNVSLDSVPVTATTQAGTGGDDDIDTDQDGLLDSEESEYGTDPRNPDSDTDGVSDGQEVTDGSNPTDRGHFIQRLGTEICSIWNSNLGMTNIIEHVNAGSTRIAVRTTLYDMSGTARGSIRFRLDVGAQQDLIVNDMQGFAANAYGRICSTVITGGAGSLDGRLVYYKSNAEGIYEFAFANPFVTGVKGRQYVEFDTRQPSKYAEDADNLVANWLQVTNIESSAQSGRVITYLADGTVLSERTIQLPARGRIDVSAHERTGEVGHVVWVPSSADARFDVKLNRYYYDNSGQTNSFAAAFSVQAKAGTGEVLTAIMDSSYKSVELYLVNTSDETNVVNVALHRSSGSLIGQEDYILLPHETKLVLPGTSAKTARIKGTAEEGVIASALHVRRERSGRIINVHSIPAESALGTVLTGSYNTFLDQGCVLHIANEMAEVVYATLSMQRYDGKMLIPGKSIKLKSHATYSYNLCSKERTEAYGKVTVQAGKSNTIRSVVVRRAPKYAYEIPTPVRE